MNVDNRILEGMILENAFNEIINEGLLDKLFKKKNIKNGKKELSKEKIEEYLNIFKEDKPVLMKILTAYTSELDKICKKYFKETPFDIYSAQDLYNDVEYSIKQGHKPIYDYNIIGHINGNKCKEYDDIQLDDIIDKLFDEITNNKTLSKYAEFECSNDDGYIIFEIYIDKSLLKLTSK